MRIIYRIQSTVCVGCVCSLRLMNDNEAGVTREDQDYWTFCAVYLQSAHYGISGTDANSSAQSRRGAVPEGAPCTQLRHGAVTSRAQTGPDEALSRQGPRNDSAVESGKGTPKWPRVTNIWGLLFLSVCVLAAGLHSLFKGTGLLNLFKTYFTQQVEQIRTITGRHDFLLIF